MKAHYLLKKNIDALLTARGHTRHDLAVWCRRGDSWISQIFTNADREVPLKYLDRMADFFGIATYQLFQPGISPLTERRKGADRRSGRDRRVSHLGQQIQATMTPVAANVTEACTGATFVYMQDIEIVNLAGESSMKTNITATTDAIV